jgi:hypothetical protein
VSAPAPLPPAPCPLPPASPALPHVQLICLTISMMAFTVVMSAIVEMFKGALAETAHEPAVHGLMEKMLWLTLLVWALFPLVWTLAWLGYVSLGTEQVQQQGSLGLKRGDGVGFGWGCVGLGLGWVFLGWVGVGRGGWVGLETWCQSCGESRQHRCSNGDPGDEASRCGGCAVHLQLRHLCSNSTSRSAFLSPLAWQCVGSVGPYQ